MSEDDKDLTFLGVVWHVDGIDFLLFLLDDFTQLSGILLEISILLCEGSILAGEGSVLAGEGSILGSDL
jgi:hypothetical protein